MSLPHRATAQGSGVMRAGPPSTALRGWDVGSNVRGRPLASSSSSSDWEAVGGKQWVLILLRKPRLWPLSRGGGRGQVGPAGPWGRELAGGCCPPTFRAL